MERGRAVEAPLAAAAGARAGQEDKAKAGAAGESAPGGARQAPAPPPAGEGWLAFMP